MPHGGGYRLQRAFARLSGWLGITGPDPEEGSVQLSPWVYGFVDLLPIAGIEMSIVGTDTVDGDGNFVLDTVPTGEMWLLKRLSILKSAGTFTVDSCNIFSQAGATQMPLAESMGLSTNVRALLGEMNHWLYPGDMIRINVTGHSVNGGVFAESRVLKLAFDITGLDT